MAEQVPAEYDPIIEAELAPVAGNGNNGLHKLPVPDGFAVLIIGAGVSGMCTAIKLQQAGIPFTILEKSPNLGGTWRDNHYPGAGVDTPNHLYSFSFAPYDWSMYFALRDELTAYLEHVADEFNLRPHIRFETAVESADYDNDTQHWRVAVKQADGSRQTLASNVLISAVGHFQPDQVAEYQGTGALCRPSLPHCRVAAGA